MKIDSIPKLISVLITLAIIGILRVVLQVHFKIFLDEKWFSLDPDILFTMACYPIYLCFFMFMCLHLALKLFKIYDCEEKLISFFFWIQLLHLLIPLIDAFGFRYNIPYNMAPYLNAQGMSFNLSLNPFADIKNFWMFPLYLTPFLLLFTRVTTLGINIAWLLAFIAFFLFLRKELKMKFNVITIVFLLMFQILYWPISKYYFVFDQLFDRITGMTIFNHYGYGTYFLIFGIIGTIYFWTINRKNIKHK